VTELRIALIVGCARSGTSILGELIAAHPAVRYVFEPHDVWDCAGLGANDSHRLTAQHATASIRSRIRDWARAQEDGALLVEKTPRNALRVPFLRAVLPEARIIHIVRDGRDVACSLVPGIGGAEWHHLRPPSWRRLLATETGVVRCAHAWTANVEIALNDLAGVPHLAIRYEDLVAQPRVEMVKILRYLGLDHRPEVDAFSTRIQDPTAGSYGARHQDVWYRPDHTRRIGRWRENMTALEQEIVGDILNTLLRRLGYA
jgi:LPS sulfotransferase NodH